MRDFRLGSRDGRETNDGNGQHHQAHRKREELGCPRGKPVNKPGQQHGQTEKRNEEDGLQVVGGPVVVFENSQTVAAARNDCAGAAQRGEQRPNTKQAKHAPAQIDALRMPASDRTKSGGDDGQAYKNPRQGHHVKRLQGQHVMHGAAREDIQGG